MVDACEEISQSLKQQKHLMLDNSADKINSKEVDPVKYIHKVDTLMLKRGNQSSWKKVLIPNELNFDHSNPYLEFCLKPDVPHPNSNPHLEISRKYEKLVKGNYSSCKEEKGKQPLLLSIFKIQPDISSTSLLNGVKNSDNPNEENGKNGQKNPREAIYLKKPVDEDKDSKKRKYEDEDFDPSIPEEPDANRKQILFTEEESFKGNPYYEFFFRSEESNLDIYTNGNFKQHANNLESVTGEKKVEKYKNSIGNSGDIFGNRYTSKDRNKFKVICPHCSKKVPAPGFARHLTYCMKVGIRKRTSRP